MFIDLVEKNRSRRGFTQRPITQEELRSLVAAARLTPATSNLQPLKYYLANTLEETAVIQPLTVWAAKLRELALPREGHCPTAFIILCHDTTIAKEPAGFQRDVGIVAQTILLAATEMGLGGCMIGNFAPLKLAQALQLPQTLIPQLVIGLGEPEEAVELVQAVDGETGYYRDEHDIHYVPKRPLEELIIDK